MPLHGGRTLYYFSCIRRTSVLAFCALLLNTHGHSQNFSEQAESTLYPWRKGYLPAFQRTPTLSVNYTGEKPLCFYGEKGDLPAFQRNTHYTHGHPRILFHFTFTRVTAHFTPDEALFGAKARVLQLYIYSLLRN